MLDNRGGGVIFHGQSPVWRKSSSEGYAKDSPTKVEINWFKILYVLGDNGDNCTQIHKIKRQNVQKWSDFVCITSNC